MNAYPTRLAVLRAGVIALLLVPGARTGASAQSLADLNIEDLMTVDAGQVFGASERLQPVTEAPSSVSFITADDIRRFGYRTLADILRGVRGMYVTDDRNFSQIGTRGFAKPGDYNSRILLLINGHRVNDNVFGQAEVGAEFGLDPAMFERVEIIRGPASSLYGDSAFFAVVNVITRTGEALGGGTLALDTGTLGTRMARASMGHRFGSGVDLAVSGTLEGSDGVERLYFPAFDAPETNHGIAEGLDGEGVKQFYGRLAYGPFTLTGMYGTRRRDVPTASFGTVFNEQKWREQTTDRHTLIDGEYGRSFKGTRLNLRASFDGFSYDGTYPMAGEEPGSTLVGRNTVVGARWSVGARLTRALFANQTLTAGAELIDNVRQDQESRFIAPDSPLFDTERSSVQQAVYLQDEIRLSRSLILDAGVRFDAYDEFTRTTPRTALIFMPSAAQSFKYLYGSAFRAPNAYELNAFYFGDTVQGLGPESIDTHELVWERYTRDWLRTSVSAYWYEADRLITLVPDPATFLGATFVNHGHVEASGLEFEAQLRLARRSQAHMSYALQRTTDEETGTELPNSPRHMTKGRLSIPGPIRGSFVSVEGLFMSGRQTYAGTWLAPATTFNVTAIQPLGTSWELVATVRNLLDADYSDPASSQHRQDSIPQNGRTARVGLRWKLWTR